MIHVRTFEYKPSEHEAEKASNSYLMSLVALIAGLPLPIINLLATLIFYLGNRKGTYFVRWHCTQALISQFTLFVINTVGFWWTLSLIFKDTELSNTYVAYIIMVLVANLTEFIATIYSAIQIRKGIHIEWWFYGLLTNQICKESW
ncbi:DUF4870 domain-containing protein [Echinicola vietnamensis]|uniref:DUF4870 domain-containing protein n=1 Tax=Echinicola vietnamensis (strain DSM 17526 / LMG 23754 / KMM 6221) TaxID=926556 RepID=L0FVG8_ECHVK|nr:DUF4870 domain-containing protein [Echinicola vietnamensis]AGA77307.1 hypothetical protein Echvi_1036 [Echinicola vietnamensis DSM 17526]